MSAIAPESFGVAATLAAYRGVTHLTGTAQQVKYPVAATEIPIGITTNTVINLTDDIPVQTSGMAKLTFGDSCVSGSHVALDSSGQGIPAVANTAGVYCIGTLVSDKVNVTGTVGLVLIRPMIKFIQ